MLNQPQALVHPLLRLTVIQRMMILSLTITKSLNQEEMCQMTRISGLITPNFRLKTRFPKTSLQRKPTLQRKLKLQVETSLQRKL